MKLIGTYSEEDFFAKKNKVDEANAEKEGIKYFFPKFRRRRGKTVVEIYGMTTEEYVKSPML